MSPGPEWRKLRQVDGAGDVDVVVLYQNKEDKTSFGYTVPVGVNDGTDEFYEAGNTERRALRVGMQHLADIAGISLRGYRARMAREKE